MTLDGTRIEIDDFKDIDKFFEYSIASESLPERFSAWNLKSLRKVLTETLPS